MRHIAMAAGLALAAPAAASDVTYLMALNSSQDGLGRRVMLFSHVDGSLIADNFINLVHVAPPSPSPHVLKGIAQVGEEIWVSDQSRGRLYRHDRAGNYIETLADELLANVRGITYDNGVVYVTMGSTTPSVTGPAIVKLDTAGNLLGHFMVDGSPFDAFLMAPGELLVSYGLGPDDLTRWSVNGTRLGIFHNGEIFWPQQINVRSSNGNYLIAGWSGTSGIYEYDQNGMQVNYIDVPSPRAAYELENGNIFWTGDGFNIYDVAGGFSTQIAIGTGQYIAAYRDLSPRCNPNCDASTTPPILNVDDFTCFINEFAAAQALPHEQQITHYANCDQSTTAPVLNVDDFTCFINAFAQGCP